jgi:hypothetical protein
MRPFRRRLASYAALVLSTLQCALLFAAPIAACCRPDQRPAAAPAAAVTCCPAAAHADGECPLHHQKADAKPAAQQPGGAAECRMRCDAAHAPDFVLGAIGVLPRPAAAIAPAGTSPFDLDRPLPLRARFALPDAPPPRAL